MAGDGEEATASRSAASSSTFPSSKLSHSQHYVTDRTLSHGEKLPQHVRAQILGEKRVVVDRRLLALLEAPVDGDEEGGIRAVLLGDGEVGGNRQSARHVLAEETDGSRREDPQTIHFLLEDEIGGRMREREPVDAAVDVELRGRASRNLRRECVCG